MNIAELAQARELEEIKHWPLRMREQHADANCHSYYNERLTERFAKEFEAAVLQRGEDAKARGRGK